MTPRGEKIFSVTLKDCVVETKRGSGKGGQNRNKRDTAVRIVHLPSGAVGESQEQRSQLLEQAGCIPPDGKHPEVSDVAAQAAR